MLEPQLNSTLGHVKRLEPTTEGDQVPEMGTGMKLWPNLKSRLMLMGKSQLVPKREVQEPLRQQVSLLESQWSTQLGLKPKQVRRLRLGW